MKKNISIFALIVTTVVITVVFWLFLEACVRVVLYVKTGDSVFIAYGFAEPVRRDAESHERIYDSKGNLIYWKCTPSDDQRNPFNRLGFRGPDIPPKSPDTIRVVCFGGSTTYGLGLPYMDTYPKLLQEELDRFAGKNRYEVINAGIAAFKLKQIIALYENEAGNLQPDIVVIMNVFNNLETDDADDFSFIRVENDDADKFLFIRMASRFIQITKQYSLLVMSASDIAQKGFRNFMRNFNWQKGADAIMRSTWLWDEMSSDLNRLFSVISVDNPAVRIIVLDEPMNIIDYPELAPPMDKAYQVQRDVCAVHGYVQHVDLKAAFQAAQSAGRKIWFASYYDPIHLSRAGNELLASVVASIILRAY